MFFRNLKLLSLSVSLIRISNPKWRPHPQVYAGTGPFSEPESQAQRDDMLALDNKLAYLTYHAYSEFIIYPYSSSYSAEAHNKGELDMVASQMVANIEVY